MMPRHWGAIDSNVTQPAATIISACATVNGFTHFGIELLVVHALSFGSRPQVPSDRKGVYVMGGIVPTRVPWITPGIIL